MNVSLGPPRQRDTTLNPLITKKQKQKNMDANLVHTCICKGQNLKDFLRYFERIRLQRQLGDSCFHPAVWVLQRYLLMICHLLVAIWGDTIHVSVTIMARDLQRLRDPGPSLKFFTYSKFDYNDPGANCWIEVG